MTPAISQQRYRTAMQAIMPAAAVLLLWAYSRPYAGIAHDAILYVGQILHARDPVNFRQDLFFAFGSQDDYSIFAKFLAWLISDSAYVGEVVRVAWIVGHFAFVLTLGVFASRFLEVRAAGVGVALASVSAYYGAFSIFSFGEPFLTARTYAEPLCIAALAMLLIGRPLFSLLLIIIAALFHPLVGGGALVVWFVFCVEARVRDVLPLVVISLVCALLLVVIRWSAIEHFLVRIDDPWFEVVGSLSQHLFVLEWQIADWNTVLLDAVIIRLAGPVLAPSPNAWRLAWSVVVASLLGVVVNLLGADLLRIALVAALQPWRTLEWMHLFAIVLLPAVVIHYWRLDQVSRVVAGLIPLALLCTAYPTGSLVSLAALLVVVVAPRISLVSRRLLRTVLLAVVAGSVILSLAEFSLPFRASGLTAYGTQEILIHAARIPLFVVLAAAGLLAAIRFRACMAIPIAFAGCWALVVLDARDGFHRLIESPRMAESPFRAIVPKGANVYWYGYPLLPWLAMNRPSFFTEQQASGAIFNRATAIEFGRRREIVGPIDVQQQACLTFNALNGTNRCSADAVAAIDVCSAVVGPDFIVLSSEVLPDPVSKWIVAGDANAQGYFLYRCADIAAKSKRANGNA